jgi:hypothetical protein
MFDVQKAEMLELWPANGADPQIAIHLKGNVLEHTWDIRGVSAADGRSGYIGVPMTQWKGTHQEIKDLRIKVSQALIKEEWGEGRTTTIPFRALVDYFQPDNAARLLALIDGVGDQPSPGERTDPVESTESQTNEIERLSPDEACRRESTLNDTGIEREAINPLDRPTKNTPMIWISLHKSTCSAAD